MHPRFDEVPMIPLLLLFACSHKPDWETGRPDDSASADDSADDSDGGNTEDCTALDLVGAMTVLDETGESCELCDASQRLSLVATLYNPCLLTVSLRFTSSCDVTSWVITDSSGTETFRQDEDCTDEDRLVSIDGENTLEASYDGTVKLDAGTYTAAATFGDVSDKEVSLLIAAQ